MVLATVTDESRMMLDAYSIQDILFIASLVVTFGLGLIAGQQR